MSRINKTMFMTVLMPLIALTIFISSMKEAKAIPAYARKYHVNCALCHSNEPRLTPFGQRVLENGYQFPGSEDGNDTAKIKLDGQQGPVTVDKLSNMMAVRLRADVQRASFRNVSNEMQSKGVDERWNIEFPKIVNFFFGGTVAKNISYFLESEYNTMDAVNGETSVKFERGFMQFSNLGKHSLANLKIGNFDPSFLFSFPTHRQQLNPIGPLADTASYPPVIDRIPALPLAFASKMFGLSRATASAGTSVDSLNEGFAILPFEPFLYNAPEQTGISIHGRPFGDGSPLLYQVGIALNDKAGGEKQRVDRYMMLRYDFIVGSADAQVSGFYYQAPDAARATLVNLGANMNDPSDNTIMYAQNPTDITRTGIGARAQWGNFDVYGTFIMDRIEKPTWSAAAAQTSQWDTNANGLSLETDWRFTPHWMLGMRYDRMKTAGLRRLPAMATMTGSANDNIDPTVQFLSPILKYYPSPNIGLYARGHFNLTPSTTLPDTGGRVSGFEGQEHPASNLRNIIAIGVDMAF